MCCGYVGVMVVLSECVSMRACTDSSVAFKKDVSWSGVSRHALLCCLPGDKHESWSKR